jgi:hypothetical protein
MKLPDKEEFNYKDCVIAGDECWLITPKEIGVKWTEDTMKFRSMIVRVSDNFIISRSFSKFFNYTEQPDLDKFPLDEPFVAYEKLDGCCDADTILITDDGVKTIKEICENDFKGSVLAYDHTTNQQVMTKVLRHLIKNNNNDWYELETDDGKILKLTGNHKVYLPELDCYREVRELVVGDCLLEK